MIAIATKKNLTVSTSMGVEVKQEVKQLQSFLFKMFKFFFSQKVSSIQAAASPSV